MGRLEGKKAVITGGAGDIGRVVAALFVAEGARVVLVDREQRRLEAVAAEVAENSGLKGEAASAAVSGVVADVTVAESVRAYVDVAGERMGGSDVFVNNAAIEGEVAPIEEADEELFEQVMAVNVKGVWLGLQQVMPVMRETGGGSIILASSVAGLEGYREMGAYVTSKHALVGLMRTAALEGAEYGIRVNTVHPAPVDSRMMRSIEAGLVPDDAEKARAAIGRGIPMKRYATADDVAGMMLFLAGDESAFCTGDTLSVDGGVTAG